MPLAILYELFYFTMHLNGVVPAHSSMCESTITTQMALKGNKYHASGVGMPFQGAEKPVIHENNLDQVDISDRPYVYCTDEVTFYNPNMDMNEDYTEAAEENELRVSNDSSENSELSRQRHSGDVELCNRSPDAVFKVGSNNSEGVNLTSSNANKGNHKPDDNSHIDLYLYSI